MLLDLVINILFLKYYIKQYDQLATKYYILYLVILYNQYKVQNTKHL